MQTFTITELRIIIIPYSILEYLNFFLLQYQIKPPLSKTKNVKLDRYLMPVLLTTYYLRIQKRESEGT